ncbi:MAG: HAD family hydrolase [Bacilli bacterium]
MYKLVIFDLDGTLLNTIEDICDSLNIALKLNNLKEVSIEECKYMVGRGVNYLIEQAIGNNTELFDLVYESYMKNYEILQKNKTRPYDGIKEILDLLKSKNIKMAVLSNKPHVDTLRVVNYYFGDNVFDIIMGKKPENRPKPYVDGAIELINTLGIHTDILYVGDTAVDMQTANDSGFTSVAVTWGFRKKSELSMANYIIETPSEILKFFGV